MGIGFSCSIVLEDDKFYNWLLTKTTPEYWFQLFVEWQKNSDVITLGVSDILTLMKADEEEVNNAVALCEKLENYFGGADFRINAIELFSSLVMLSNIEYDYKHLDSFQELTAKVKFYCAKIVERPKGALMGKFDPLDEAILASPLDFIKLFPGSNIAETETYRMNSVYNLIQMGQMTSKEDKKAITKITLPSPQKAANSIAVKDTALSMPQTWDDAAGTSGGGGGPTVTSTSAGSSSHLTSKYRLSVVGNLQPLKGTTRVSSKDRIKKIEAIEEGGEGAAKTKKVPPAQRVKEGRVVEHFYIYQGGNNRNAARKFDILIARKSVASPQQALVTNKFSRRNSNDKSFEQITPNANFATQLAVGSNRVARIPSRALHDWSNPEKLYEQKKAEKAAERELNESTSLGPGKMANNSLASATTAGRLNTTSSSGRAMRRKLARTHLLPRSSSVPAPNHALRLDSQLFVKIDMLIEMKLLLNQRELKVLHPSQVVSLYAQTCKGIFALTTNGSMPTLNEIQQTLYELGLNEDLLEDDDLAAEDICNLFSNQFLYKHFWRRVVICELSQLELQAFSKFKVFGNKLGTLDRKGGLRVSLSNPAVIDGGARVSMVASTFKEASASRRRSDDTGTRKSLSNKGLGSIGDKSLWYFATISWKDCCDIWNRATSLGTDVLEDAVRHARKLCEDVGVELCKCNLTRSEVIQGFHDDYHYRDLTTYDLTLLLIPALVFEAMQIRTRLPGASMSLPIRKARDQRDRHASPGKDGDRRDRHRDHDHKEGHRDRHDKHHHDKHDKHHYDKHDKHHHHDKHSPPEHGKTSHDKKREDAKKKDAVGKRSMSNTNSMKPDVDKPERPSSHLGTDQPPGSPGPVSPTTKNQGPIVSVISSHGIKRERKRRIVLKHSLESITGMLHSICNIHDCSTSDDSPKKQHPTLEQIFQKQRQVDNLSKTYWSGERTIVGSHCFAHLKRMCIQLGGHEVFGHMDLENDLFAYLPRPRLVSGKEFVREVGAWLIQQDRLRHRNRLEEDFLSLAMELTDHITELETRQIFAWVLQDTISVPKRELGLFDHVVTLLGDLVLEEMHSIHATTEVAASTAKRTQSIRIGPGTGTGAVAGAQSNRSRSTRVLENASKPLEEGAELDASEKGKEGSPKSATDKTANDQTTKDGKDPMSKDVKDDPSKTPNDGDKKEDSSKSEGNPDGATNGPMAVNADGAGAKTSGTDGKGADGKANDGKGSDGKATDGKGNDGKANDGKGNDGKANDGKGSGDLAVSAPDSKGTASPSSPDSNADDDAKKTTKSPNARPVSAIKFDEAALQQVAPSAMATGMPLQASGPGASTMSAVDPTYFYSFEEVQEGVRILLRNLVQLQPTLETLIKDPRNDWSDNMVMNLLLAIIKSIKKKSKKDASEGPTEISPTSK